MDEVRPVAPVSVLEPKSTNPRLRRLRANRGLIWAGVLGVAFGLGAWVADPLQMVPRPFTHPAKLAIAIEPDGPFTIRVSKSVSGADGKTYGGSSTIEIAPGDYFVDVIPGPLFQAKKLKVHLSPDQKLALPVHLNLVPAEPRRVHD